MSSPQPFFPGEMYDHNFKRCIQACEIQWFRSVISEQSVSSRSAIISQHECEIHLPTLFSADHDQERHLQLPAGSSHALEAVSLVQLNSSTAWMRKFTNQEITANSTRAGKANGRILRPTTSEGVWHHRWRNCTRKNPNMLYHMLIISWLVAENRRGFHCGQGNYSDET
jgi:hypothetical protein